MTPNDLLAFRKRFRLSKKATGFLFGCDPRTIKSMETGKSEIPGSIALAASAYAMNLPPYGTSDKVDVSKLINSFD